MSCETSRRASVDCESEIRAISFGPRKLDPWPVVRIRLVMIVDGLLVSVGSTNFDNRSFRLNDGATLNILDTAFARDQTAIFEEDLKRSRAISFATWSDRPWKEKFDERLASLFGSQL